jgi:hypothetical protein
MEKLPYSVAWSVSGKRKGKPFFFFQSCESDIYLCMGLPGSNNRS